MPEPIKTASEILKVFFTQSDPLKGREDGAWKLRRCEGSIITKDEKEECIVWPFPIKQELGKQALKHPIYVAFTLKILPDETIKEVNIKIFREDVSQSVESGITPTELLLRAEWSNEPQPQEQKRHHAQPHWHVHSYQVVDKMGHLPSDKQKTILEMIDDEPESASPFADVEAINSSSVEDKEAELPLFRFHLAMLADWDKDGDNTVNKELDNKTLKNWLPKCLEYIKHQLEYMLDKLPK